MNSVEFGLTPLQTIFDDKILDAFERRKYIYEELDEETKKEIENYKKLEKKIKKKRKIIKLKMIMIQNKIITMLYKKK